jgi:hypothetical protein
MHAWIMALIGGLALASSAQASRLAPKPLKPVIYIRNQEWAPLPNELASLAAVDASPPIQLVAGGCGWGLASASLAGPLGLLALGALCFGQRSLRRLGAGWYYPYRYLA